MTNIDKAVHDQSASSKVEKVRTVIDRGDPSDGAWDRDHFSHHHEDDIIMGDCEEYRTSKMVTDGKYTVDTDHKVSND